MGLSWCNISVQEMVQFLGVLFKMSVVNRELGGYPAYFTEPIPVNLSVEYLVKLRHYPTLALEVFLQR